VHGSARIKNLDNFKITFYGGDTNTAPDGGSYSNYLKEMALKCNNNLINIAGKLPQNELWDKLGEEVDAFIFPSRFENYPNALLEVIELGLPIAVSANGGMPEILQLNGYENWIEFFPTHEGVEKAINWIIENSKKNILINSLDCATEINGKIVESYNILINDSTSVSNSIDVISKKSISVVTPHFNQSNLIDELLKSTLQIVSCGIDLELLIVDDGSAANEISNLESKIKNYSYVKIIKSSDGVNVGPAKQRYLGACQAKNEIILFCDADDYVSVDFIVNSLSALNADQSVEYCIAPHKAFGLESYVWMPSPASNITIMWENYTNSGIVIRKNSLRREWFYVDYDASEDWFTSAMILLNLSKYIVYPEIGYFYRRIGRSRSTQNIEFLNSAERLVRYEIIRSCISSGKLNAIQIESIFRRAIFEIPPVSVFNQNYSIKSYLKNFIIKILEFFGLKKFVKYFYKLIFNYLVKF
jgi:glycosyltransferase involved in cell wall biosynthesis